MAYTNGVFFIDLYSGSDTARTALTSCVASNPSGSVTSIAKTGHGLTTGAVVDLTAFTAWLNGAWKITVTDANNFTLDDATWQTTADPNGTVTPRGGSSWADAWRTITSGATATRIQPGDEIRVSKTPDPVSLGQSATFTDGSQDVVLTTAVTKAIEDANKGTGGAWTVSANVTGTNNTSRKFGSTAATFAPAGAFTTGKVAYAAIAGGGTADFSAFQYINLWYRATSNTNIAANTYKICLCSDTTGDTIVNEINLPATNSNSSWQCLVLDYGGALGSSIQSVSIHCLVDPGASPVTFSVNNIFASNGDLSLKTLIGKSGDVNYNIQSISGTTIKIDSNNSAATGRGYSGSTSTETLYYRVPFDVITTSIWATVSENAAFQTQRSKLTGGWNTSSGSRDGQTVIANSMVNAGTGISFSNGFFYDTSYFTIARFSSPLTTAANISFTNFYFCGAGALSSTSGNNTFLNCKFLNTSASHSFTVGESNFINCEFRSAAGYAINSYGQNSFISCTFANNGSGSIFGIYSSKYGSGAILARNCQFLDSTEFGVQSNSSQVLWSFDHDDTPGNHWGFFTGGTVNLQTSVVHASEPVAWKVSLTSTNASQYNPITIRLGPFAVAASALVTITAWIKKDHATDVAAKLYVEDELYNLDGVVADSATKADDTSWEELTITFTPTEKGAIPVFVDAWYVAGASNVYIGSITVTQA